jgi:manganese transport protein
MIKINNIKLFFISILPGLFLIGLNIGTGSVTAMAKAGAHYGMSLLWTIAISSYITYFLINIYGKFTIVTKETALFSFKKHIHSLVGVFFLVALTINVSGSVMGVMGIIADVCYEWSLNYTDTGIHPVLFASFFIIFVYLLFLIGKTRSIEKALAIIVGIMSFSFILNFFMLMPSLESVLNGLIPKIPKEVAQTGDSPYLVVASMVGTTVFSGLFIIRTILVRESGWTIKSLKVQRRDAIISALMMFIISTSIMASAASMLFNSGISLDNASQMLNLLQPLAGPLASTIFGIGIIAAGISSQFPNVIMLPMLLSDYSNSPLNLRKWQVRLIVLGISLLGLVVPVFKAPPVLVMIASQAFGALLLPFTVICMLYLGNKRELMKSYTFKTKTNIIMIVIVLFSLFMAYNSIKGIVTLIL